MALPIFTPGNLIVCDPVSGTDCDYAALIHLVRVFIGDLVVVSTFIATFIFIYAGFELLRSGGDPGALKKAKGMLWKVVVGYFIILVAWLIIYTVVNTLAKSGYTAVLGTP